MSSIGSGPGTEIPLLGPAAPRGPAGIGGWLLLVALGQVLATFSLPASVVHELLDPENRKLFGEFPLAMYGELILNVVLVLIVLATTLLLFRKSRHFPRVLILECIAGPLIPLVGIVWSAFAFSHQLNRPIGDFLEIDVQELTRLVVAAISAVIWIAYALKSKRVRNTYILGLSARDMSGEAETIETSLLLVIGAVIFMLGMSSIVFGVVLTMQRGVFNYSILGGVVQAGLALWLLRGSDVARLLLALLYGLGTVLSGWLALSLKATPPAAIIPLVMAVLSAVVFWFLAFSKRLHAELEINEAKYAKPADEEASDR